MLIKKIQLAAFQVILISCLSSCAVTKNHNESGNSIPENWSPVIAPESEDCTSVDGEYQNYGIGKLKDGEPLTQVRLDAELGYAFPSQQGPEKVGISLDRNSNLLNIKFGRPINRNFARPAICLDGWLKIEQNTTNQYLGDGTTLDYSISEIHLAKSDDGDLILHLFFDVKSSSFLIFSTRDMGESWSKFKEVNSEN